MKRKHSAAMLLILGAGIISVATRYGFAIPEKSHTLPKTSVMHSPLPILHVNKKLRLKKSGAGSDPVSVADAAVAQNAQYSVSGNSSGLVSVINVVTGSTVSTFQMTVNVPVRQVFLLNNGQTVGAAQKDHTTFWNMTSGNVVATVNEEAYGFSYDGSKFITYANGCTYLDSYPGMQHLITFNTNGSGPEEWNFSLDGHYMALALSSTRPSTDVQYPSANRGYGDYPVTFLYDLTTNTPDAAYQPLAVNGLGSFSADSQKYDISDGFLYQDSGTLLGGFELDMPTGQITQFQ